jgi:glycosyltransferase involved in cell wall biosynthesis
LDCVINGRFLGRPLTGVQRYASEIVRALDDLLAERNGRADMLAPRLDDPPLYRAIDVSQTSIASGYLWEQCELPLRAGRPILSLCNVGPLAAPAQIVCMHDANVFRCPEAYSRMFRLLYRALLPRLARRVSQLTTVSCASRDELAELFSISQDGVAVLPNGHEHVLDWRAGRSALAGIVSSFRPFVLMIGSAARHKNNGAVLALAEALDGLGLDVVVAGGGGAIFADVPQSLAGNVHVLGRVSDDDLACLYGAALCLAFPSRSEGFGLPLLEAMALGCPVVAASIPSSLEVCGDSALYAGPDDPEAWLAAIARFANSSGLRAEMSGRGQVRARAYSWRRSAQGYLDLMREARL